MKIKDLPNEPPKYLAGVSRYMWRRIVPLLKENTAANEMDKALVETLCDNYKILRDSYESIKEFGSQYAIYEYIYDNDDRVIDKHLKAIKKNPAVDNLDKATKNIRAISTELGLTPQSRSEMLKIKDDDSTGEDINEQMKAYM